MYAYQHQLTSCYVPVDQHTISRRASRSFERLVALRDRRTQRKAERRRADHRSQESYATAV